MKKYNIGIIGLGYVGLPLLITVAEKNISVLGFDISNYRVDSLNKAGDKYIKSIDDNRFDNVVNGSNEIATTDFSRLKDCQNIIICVPTPLSKNREPDLSYIVDSTQSVADNLQKGQMVVLESTTYPGTMNDVMRPILEKTGLKSGVDFFLAYSPEREDPGNPNFQTDTITKIVGGDCKKSRDLAVELYSKFINNIVPVSSTSTAEAVKLTENIFRSVNIALVNELKIVFDKMGIDVWEVINAAKTKPFGFMPFYPGPGLGGHCIPIDPFYLTWKAREYDISTRFIELAGEINQLMPDYVVKKTARALDETFCKGLNQTKILIIGVAYKKNIDDYRESPSLKVISLLQERGASVDYYDPYIEMFNDSGSGLKMESVSIDEAKNYDAVVICTEHSSINWQKLIDDSKLIIDTRNICSEFKSDKVVKA